MSSFAQRLRELSDKATAGEWKFQRDGGDDEIILIWAKEPFTHLLGAFETDAPEHGENHLAHAALVVHLVNHKGAIARAVEALEMISNGDGVYGAQAFEYKQIARSALSELDGNK